MRSHGILLFFLHSALSAGSTYFLSLFLDNALGFSGSQIGLIAALRACTTFLSAYPAGYFCGRVAPQWLFRIALAVQALSVSLLSRVATVPALLAVYLPYVVASELAGVLFDALFMSRASRRASGQSQEIFAFQSAKFFGLGLGTLLTGYLLDGYDFPSFFWLIAVGFLALTPLTGRGLVIDRSSSLERAAVGTARASAIPLMLFAFLVAVHWGAEITILPLFLQKELGFSHSFVGLYFSLEVCSLGLTTLLLTFRRYDVARSSAGMSALLLSIIGTVGTAMPAVWASVLFRVIHGVGDALLFGHLFARMSTLSQDREVGKLSGLFHAVTMLALCCGSLLYPWLGDRLGLGAALALSGVAMLPGLGALYVRGTGSRHEPVMSWYRRPAEDQKMPANFRTAATTTTRPTI